MIDDFKYHLGKTQFSKSVAAAAALEACDFSEPPFPHQINGDNHTCRACELRAVDIHLAQSRAEHISPVISFNPCDKGMR